jgi:hypothetical protein
MSDRTERIQQIREATLTGNQQVAEPFKVLLAEIDELNEEVERLKLFECVNRGGYIEWDEQRWWSNGLLSRAEERAKKAEAEIQRLRAVVGASGLDPDLPIPPSPLTLANDSVGKLRQALTDILDHDDGNRLNYKEITEIAKEAMASVPERDDRIEKATEIAIKYGGIDGAHHKDWVIDQMVRALCGSPYTENEHGFRFYGESAEYLKLVRDACDGEDGPDTYGWETGIAP